MPSDPTAPVTGQQPGSSASPAVEHRGGPATTSATAPARGATRHTVDGRYSGSAKHYRVELRVDVEGPTATKRVSADYYTLNGATLIYTGSMRLDAATVVIDPTAVTITGTARFSFSVSAPRIRVSIPRSPTDSPRSNATLEHLNDADDPTTTFTCAWESHYFRSVLFEQASQDTVGAAFQSYDTGALPSGSRCRSLSIVDAYADAGIDLQPVGGMDLVDTSEAGPDGAWSDAELHAAMVNHFASWKDSPQWAVWLFHAHMHDQGPGLLGLMFDQDARQRQGAAAFYAGMAGTTDDMQRLQLFCCTHELGHSFNLLHSWTKALGTPPAPNRADALSWMNYPQNYLHGVNPKSKAFEFWKAFEFAFDTLELIHLRHGFRNDVIQGGNAFTTGSALHSDTDWDAPVNADTGLELRLSAPARFGYGEPVAVDLHLTATSPQPTPIRLRPRNGSVEFAIRRPTRRWTVYAPLLRQCWVDEAAPPPRPGVVPQSETAFLHYGSGGFYFDTPGQYRLRARIAAPDGSIVMSNAIELHVQPPITTDDQGAAHLLFGDQQGALLYLVGSDFDGLRDGNDALTELRERYPHHPLAQVARVVQGTNAAREFKMVGPKNTVTVRPSDRETAAALLTPVFDVQTATRAQRDLGLYAFRANIATNLVVYAAHPESKQVGAYIKSRRREIAVEIGPGVPE